MTQNLVKAQMVYDVKYHFYTPPNADSIAPETHYNVDGHFEYTSSIVCSTENTQGTFVPPGETHAKKNNSKNYKLKTTTHTKKKTMKLVKWSVL